MTWTTTPYCTRQDVILTLDPNVNTVDYPFIDELIVIAQADLDREIGYSFQQDGTSLAPASRVYNGQGTNELWIDDLISTQTDPAHSGCTTPSGQVNPCWSVSETFQYPVLVNGVWIMGSSTINDISADAILQPNNFSNLGIPARKIVRNSGLPFQEGKQNYKVFGVFGMPILVGQLYPGVPNDIMRAAIRLAVHYYRMRDTAYASLVQAQGGIREHYEQGWPADVVAIVRKYRHQRFYSQSPGSERTWSYFLGV